MSRTHTHRDRDAPQPLNGNGNGPNDTDRLLPNDSLLTLIAAPPPPRVSATHFNGVIHTRRKFLANFFMPYILNWSESG